MLGLRLMLTLGLELTFGVRVKLLLGLGLRADIKVKVGTGLRWNAPLEASGSPADEGKGGVTGLPDCTLCPGVAPHTNAMGLLLGCFAGQSFSIQLSALIY